MHGLHLRDARHARYSRPSMSRCGHDITEQTHWQSVYACSLHGAKLLPAQHSMITPVVIDCAGTVLFCSSRQEGDPQEQGYPPFGPHQCPSAEAEEPRC